MPNANSEFATLPITVGNDDIDNLIVTTSVGATARGVVVTDDGSAPTFRAGSGVRSFAQPAEPGMHDDGRRTEPRQRRLLVRDDGLFDRRLIRANVGGQGLSMGWYLKAVLLDGEDVTDSGIEFTPGRSYDGLQVVFTRKTTDLSGLVTDDRNKPVLDATVVIFPANQRTVDLSIALRADGCVPTPTAATASSRCRRRDDYLIIAVQNLEQGQGSDPEFLARAQRRGEAVLAE